MYCGHLQYNITLSTGDFSNAFNNRRTLIISEFNHPNVTNMAYAYSDCNNHAGYILALEEAKKHCDYLIVALNTHPDGKQPVQSVFERYTQLCAVKWVDRVIPYQGREDLEKLASVLDYQVRFLGEDYIDREWDGKVQERV